MSTLPLIQKCLVKRTIKFLGPQWKFGVSMAQWDACPTCEGGSGLDPCWVRQNSFMEMNQEMFSRITHSLLMIKGVVSFWQKNVY